VHAGTDLGISSLSAFQLLLCILTRCHQTVICRTVMQGLLPVTVVLSCMCFSFTECFDLLCFMLLEAPEDDSAEADVVQKPSTERPAANAEAAVVGKPSAERHAEKFDGVSGT